MVVTSSCTVRRLGGIDGGAGGSGEGTRSSARSGSFDVRLPSRTIRSMELAVSVEAKGSSATAKSATLA